MNRMEEYLSLSYPFLLEDLRIEDLLLDFLVENYLLEEKGLDEKYEPPIITE